MTPFFYYAFSFSNSLSVDSFSVDNPLFNFFFAISLSPLEVGGFSSFSLYIVHDYNNGVAYHFFFKVSVSLSDSYGFNMLFASDLKRRRKKQL